MSGMIWPLRSQSPGVLNSPPIIITTGGAGGAAPANQAGGRYTYSVRCLKPLAESGIRTGTTTPLDMFVFRSAGSASGSV